MTRARRRRAGVIAFDGDRVLLMLRHKRGRDYAILIGGKVEGEESLEECALRELAEETGLSGPILRRLPDVESYWRTVFLVSTSGEPRLGGPEARRANASNRYRPAWVPLAELDRIALEPAAAAGIIRQARGDLQRAM